MRGFVFMLEAVFAGIILVGFMIFLAGNYNAASDSQENMFSGVLTELDDRDILRGYAYSGDTQSIEDELRNYGYSMDVVLCDASSCTGNPPEKDTVWVSSYLFSGDDTVDPLEVRLYAWEA